MLRRFGRARGLGVLAILSLVVAYATLLQGPGYNQNSHYALTRALAEGTPSIDHTRYETGPFWVTGDISSYRGHTYSNKAPGFAFATLPAYLVLKAVGGAQPARDVSGQLWLLGLWSVILPSLVLLLLVRKLANEIEPGFGTAATVVLGLATLMLPFATLFFSHILSALLGFAAFFVLWRERQGPPRLSHVAVAGLLAGYAITTEFPNAITAAILGLAALTRGHPFRRALAYGGGALVGLAPLLAYDQWAFGSPFHVSYRYTVGFGSTGSLFLATPSFRRLMEVLFAPTGSFRTTPVIALAGVGGVALFRRGYRFEACVAAAVALSFLFFEASYLTPFGGSSPGPRQLLPMLPFVALPLATALRRMPLTTLSLAAVSAVEMVAATITHPLYYSEQSANWFHRLGVDDFSATILSFLSRRPSLDSLALRSTADWYPLLLFFVPALLAIALTAAERPPFSRRHRDAFRAAICLLGWVVLEHEAPKLLYGSPAVGKEWAPALVLGIAGVVSILASLGPYLPSSRAVRGAAALAHVHIGHAPGAPPSSRRSGDNLDPAPEKAPSKRSQGLQVRRRSRRR